MTNTTDYITLREMTGKRPYDFQLEDDRNEYDWWMDQEAEEWSQIMEEDLEPVCGG